MSRNAKETKYRQKIRNDYPFYAQNFLYIRTKKGAIRRFKLNTAQKYLHAKIESQKAETGKVRVLILKGRQQGCSTYVGGRYYHMTCHHFGIRTFILTHELDATANLFEMVNRFHEHMIDDFKPSTGKSNRKELIFDILDSGYRVGTAGSKGVGRSSTIQLFHGCLSTGTFILDGNDNLRRMDSFKIGDTVRTHSGAIAKISLISRQIRPAFNVTLKGNGKYLPLTATAEHRFLTPRGWQKLSDINSGDFLLFPIKKINKTLKQWPFRLKDSIRPQGGGRKETGPDKVEPSYALGRILGLYLAEGVITKQYKTNTPSAVTFAVNENEVERTQKWLSDINFLFVSQSTQPRKKSKTVTITAYGKSFATFVLNLCGELDGKRLPSNWHCCGYDFIEGLIHGYISGDGHSSKREYDRRITAPSIRAAITIGLRDALASLGYGWSCIYYHPGRLRYDKRCKPIWHLRLCGLGVDRLCNELEWKMPPRRRNGAYQSIEIKNGYAYVPVLNIEYAGDKSVMDFEVDHEDHSYCTIHCATHNSEVAFWPNAEDHAAGIIQAIPDQPGTEVIFESTANGLGNYFHKKWQEAELGDGEYIPIFIPWFWQKEYRSSAGVSFELTAEEKEYMRLHNLDVEQIAWRRNKIIELRDPLLFKQEYPATPNEAFQTTGIESYIKSSDILSARQQPLYNARGAVVAGYDPARDGDDRDGFIYRQNLNAFGLEYKKFKTFPERLAYLLEKLKSRDPYIDKLFIDYGGSGWELAGMLNETEHAPRIIVVNFGAAALRKDAYVNKRAEMYGELKKWLVDEDQVPCLPDNDALHSDLTAACYTYDSKTRLKLERKAEIKKRGLRSPDGADALALTFAFPIAATMKKTANPIPVRSHY